MLWRDWLDFILKSNLNNSWCLLSCSNVSSQFSGYSNTSHENEFLSIIKCYVIENIRSYKMWGFIDHLYSLYGFTDYGVLADVVPFG